MDPLGVCVERGDKFLSRLKWWKLVGSGPLIKQLQATRINHQNIGQTSSLTISVVVSTGLSELGRHQNLVTLQQWLG